MFFERPLYSRDPLRSPTRYRETSVCIAFCAAPYHSADEDINVHTEQYLLSVVPPRIARIKCVTKSSRKCLGRIPERNGENCQTLALAGLCGHYSATMPANTRVSKNPQIICQVSHPFALRFFDCISIPQTDTAIFTANATKNTTNTRRNTTTGNR